MAFGSPQWMYASGEDYYEYKIPYSMRFDKTRTAYLYRTMTSNSNRKVWTWSCWLKRSSTGQHVLLNAPSNNGYTRIETDGDSIWLLQYNANTSTYEVMVRTTAVFRDLSAWYHIVVAYDSTQGTEANRVKIYVNGTQITDFHTGGSNTFPSQNREGGINNDEAHRIGYNHNYGSYYLDGLLAEVHFLDGIAGTAANFGEAGSYGDWKPIEYTGSHGTNGFYLDFADDGNNMGDDESANTNDWTVSGAQLQMLDSPTNNFCTINGAEKNVSEFALTEGNLKVTREKTTGEWDSFRGTMGASSGKWYFEWIWKEFQNNALASTRFVVGWIPFNDSDNEGFDGRGANGTCMGLQGSAQGYGFLPWTQQMAHQDAGGSGNNYGATIGGSFAEGDVLQCALDLDNNTIKYGKNNSWGNGSGSWNQTYANGFSFSTADHDGHVMMPAASIRWDSGDEDIGIFNFGQDSSFVGEKTSQGNGDDGDDFYYDPPAGFKSLKNTNLPSTIKPSDHFKTIIYDGNGTTGASAQTVTGVGFEPGMTWLKNREDSGPGHVLTDALRGTGQSLHPNNEGASNSNSTSGHLSAWNSDGFVLYGGTRVNQSGESHVAWNWKASSTASGSTGGSGTAKSYSARYNATAGFSMITYTGNGTAGQTIPHHLGATPDFIVVKSYSNSNVGYIVYHSHNTTAPETDHYNWVVNEGTSDHSGMWNDVAPTSSVFTIGDNANVNDSSGTWNYIAYCWRAIDGYSSFGSYTGNGDNDGSYIYTGFRPSLVITKHLGDGNGWWINDTTRFPYNPSYNGLKINESTSESSHGTKNFDIYSNGFKSRQVSGYFGDAADYIYLAFAETPFKYANAR